MNASLSIMLSLYCIVHNKPVPRALVPEGNSLLTS